MIKKILLLLILTFLLSPATFSKEVQVKLTPVNILTTANLNLKEGDLVEFFVVDDVNNYFKKGQKVYSTLISREENGFLGQVATMYFENFYTKDLSGKRLKLNGIIYKRGTNHDVITGFLLDIVSIIRGGEVWIKPDKDIFTLYAEVN